MSEILTILNDFSEDWAGNDSIKVESFFSRIKSFYDSNKRHQYSEITAFIYNKNVTDEGLEILSNNLLAIREHARSIEFYDIMDKIDKMYDHIQLAIYQKAMFENIYNNAAVINQAHLTNLQEEAERLDYLTVETQHNVTLLDDQLERHQEDVEHLREALEGLEGKESSILTQFVTILGIFASIMFAAFGGFQIISNTIGQLNQDIRIGMLMIFSSMIMIGVVALLYILLGGIARITEKNFEACDCKAKGEECSHYFYEKHPAFAVVLFVLMYFFILGLSAFVFDYGDIFNWITSKNYIGIGGQFLGVLLIIGWPLVFWLLTLYLKWRRSDRSQDSKGDNVSQNVSENSSMGKLLEAGTDENSER